MGGSTACSFAFPSFFLRLIKIKTNAKIATNATPPILAPIAAAVPLDIPSLSCSCGGLDGVDMAVAVAVIVVIGGIELADLKIEEIVMEEEEDGTGVGV